MKPHIIPLAKVLKALAFRWAKGTASILAPLATAKSTPEPQT